MTYATLCYRPSKEIWVNTKITVVSSGTVTQTRDLENFTTATRSSLGVVNKVHRRKDARGLLIAPPTADAPFLFWGREGFRAPD